MVRPSHKGQNIMANHNVKASVNSKGKLIIVIDPDADLQEAKTGKSDLLASCRWMDLSELDERLDGMKINLIISKAKGKKAAAGSRRGRRDADEDTGRTPRSRRSRKVEEPEEVEEESDVTDLADLEEDALADLCYDVLEVDVDTEGWNKRKMIRSLKAEGVIGARVGGTKRKPTYEAVREDESGDEESGEEAEVVKLRSLEEDEIRALYKEVIGKRAPRAMTKAQMVKALKEEGVTEASRSGEDADWEAVMPETENDDPDASDDADDSSDDTSDNDETDEEPGPSRARLGRRSKAVPAAKSGSKSRPADRAKSRRARR